MNVSAASDRRVLVVDDNLAIHSDFLKIFAPPGEVSDELDRLEAELFDAPSRLPARASVVIDVAAQGEEGLAKVMEAVAGDRPYAVAFVDMRMPPGWDGLETIERMWRVDPEMQVVICSAYSDHSWDELRARLGERDGLLIIKKPFDPIEVVQCVHALTTKWKLAREARKHVHGLEAAVQSRTADLEAANQRLSEEMREREKIESELRLAQKLEAIGQLAAGVAHEINTPIQFVGDSLYFVSDGVQSLLGLVGGMRTAAGDGGDLSVKFDGLCDDVDLPYLDDQMPQAIDRMRDGIGRVAEIVRSMKELTHPGVRELAPVDINRQIDNALRVTAGKFRSVADVVTDLADLPTVTVYQGELGQVLLNLIVNAADAMEDCESRTGARGRLTVRTRVDGDDVVISVGDTGAGIPEAIRERIFEAFFTTKEVGRGTGQGLAIARKIVVDRHRGALTFDSATGVGTTFHVRIPIAGPIAAHQIA